MLGVGGYASASEAKAIVPAGDTHLRSARGRDDGAPLSRLPSGVTPLLALSREVVIHLDKGEPRRPELGDAHVSARGRRGRSPFLRGSPSYAKIAHDRECSRTKRAMPRPPRLPLLRKDCSRSGGVVVEPRVVHPSFHPTPFVLVVIILSPPRATPVPPL